MVWGLRGRPGPSARVGKILRFLSVGLGLFGGVVVFGCENGFSGLKTHDEFFGNAMNDFSAIFIGKIGVFCR